MTPISILITLFLLLVPFVAGADPVKLALVPILSPTSGPHPDLDDLLQRFWRNYYKADGAQGFDLSQVRVGRVDLNDDDEAELILMVDSPSWRADGGYPFVIATWIDKQWNAVGWGWGDPDGIFSLTETIHGWHSVETTESILRWNGSQYDIVPKNTEPPAPGR